MSDSPEAPKKNKPVLMRRSHPIRDNIEGILAALVLALIVRHFVLEVYVIPTGSMAPTLYGRHRDLECPNCKFGFATDGDVRAALCRNCGYEFDEKKVLKTFCTCLPSKPQKLFWKGGNRVAVNKFIRHFETPKRWDVVVFKYPFVDTLCKNCGQRDKFKKAELPKRCPVCNAKKLKTLQKNYIKRLIGLPGEEITIRHGDVYVDGKIERKPKEIQEILWQFVYDSRYQILVDPSNAISPRWTTTSGAVQHEGGVFDLTPDADQPAFAQYDRTIWGFNPYNGAYLKNFSPIYALGEGDGMGDLRIGIQANLNEAGVAILQITEDSTTYTAKVRFGSSETQTSIAANGKIIAEHDLALSTKEDHRITFSNVDDRLELYADGNLIIRHDIDSSLGSTPTKTNNGSAGFGVSGSHAKVQAVTLEHDIYYLTQPRNPDVKFAPSTDIPQDHFYVMGDNSASSYDSRFWGYVPEKLYIGKADVIWWPLSRLRTIR